MQPSDNQPAAGRRRFMAGGVSAPVLMSLASPSVMAGTCMTASASTSMNPSGMARHQADKGHVCNGWSPERWLEALNTHGLNETDVAKLPLATVLSPQFSFATYESGKNLTDRDVTDWLVKGKSAEKDEGKGKDRPRVIDVLKDGSKFEKAIVATAFNLSTGKISSSVLSGRSAAQIWDEVNSARGFEPYGGMIWTPDQVATWLAGTWQP